MKITREVRDFAAKQNSESYLASENVRSETSAKQADEARQGMAEMTRVYKETGRELYIGQGSREHD
ncbi:hypothetical protein AAW00_11350 [Aurantiacibacter luteus]|uniref:Uncharacterized protein n=1 Tax=Aurantiacibacter luteus TaxID=1581420 RepID=A0A0G9MW00_9SPHN|nr:hypothetical protein AAW00_11350 [Aurantiacibacter luteus]